MRAKASGSSVPGVKVAALTPQFQKGERLYTIQYIGGRADGAVTTVLHPPTQTYIQIPRPIGVEALWDSNPQPYTTTLIVDMYRLERVSSKRYVAVYQYTPSAAERELNAWLPDPWSTAKPLVLRRLRKEMLGWL